MYFCIHIFVFRMRISELDVLSAGYYTVAGFVVVCPLIIVCVCIVCIIHIITLKNCNSDWTLKFSVAKLNNFFFFEYIIFIHSVKTISLSYGVSHFYLYHLLIPFYFYFYKFQGCYDSSYTPCHCYNKEPIIRLFFL